jgi:excisionase family DNA binding protein
MAAQRGKGRADGDGAADQGPDRIPAGQRGGIMPEDPLLTPAQVAARLQMSPLTVMHWLRTGRLPGVKLAKFWRVRASALEAFLYAPPREGRARPHEGEAGVRPGPQPAEADPPTGDSAQATAALVALIHTLFPEGQLIAPRTAYGLTTFPLYGVNLILAQHGLVLHASETRHLEHCVACTDRPGRVHFYGVFELRRLVTTAPSNP